MSDNSNDDSQRVVFRKWRNSSDIIALFPEIPTDIIGSFCLSYERVGQHAAADYYGVINHTSSAKPHEFAGLADELVRVGYHVKPLKRTSQRHHERRRMVAKSCSSTHTS